MVWRIGGIEKADDSQSPEQWSDASFNADYPYSIVSIYKLLLSIRV